MTSGMEESGGLEMFGPNGIAIGGGGWINVKMSTTFEIPSRLYPPPKNTLSDVDVDARLWRG